MRRVERLGSFDKGKALVYLQRATVTPSSDPPFGQVLREAREARGISLREIAVSTKISKAALEALERDDIGNLPGGIFTRSFVRSYADAVGLDPEATLQDFLARFPTDGERKAPVSRHESLTHDKFQSQQQMARTVLSLALASIPLIVFLVYLGMRGTSEDLAEAQAAADAAAVSEIQRARAVTPTAPPPVSTPVRPASPPVAEAAALGPLTIDIRPTGDCWVSATVDGKRLFSRVMRAGEWEVLEAETEVVVNIGDAGAFAFAINQRPGRSLGTPGEVVTARINRENYRSFVTE